MSDHNVNVAALIGSRICHDLISPVGAVTNGLELLSMSGVSNSPELELVNNSAADASARIRLFRLAFGTAAEDQNTGSDELQKILNAHYSDGRIKTQWSVPESLPKPVAQAVVLGVLCVEQSIPYGGHLNITGRDLTWKITGTADRTKTKQELWAGLTGQSELAEIAPADVQYVLLRDLLRKLGRVAQIDQMDNGVSLTF